MSIIEAQLAMLYMYKYTACFVDGFGHKGDGP